MTRSRDRFRYLQGLVAKEAQRMATLDLDAKRAARAEASMTPHEVILGGKTYRLRARMPLEFTDHLNEGRIVEAVKLLLIDPTEWEQLRLAVPDDEDLLAITELYAVDLPESPASAPSSPNGGTPVRPISSATTRSTSARRPTGRKR
jgi:hypothetical protein